MPKSNSKDGRRSAKSCKQPKTTKGSVQKMRKKKDESQPNVIQSGKVLSRSFYNQQTLTGSKKIMLDLIPIECVQTQHYLIPDDLQLCNFGKWKKKSSSREILDQNKLNQNKSSCPTQHKPPKIQNCNQLNKKSSNRKNSTTSLSVQKRYKVGSPNPEKKQKKVRNKQQCTNKQKNQKLKIGGRYMQLYLNGYFKKVLLSK